MNSKIAIATSAGRWLLRHLLPGACALCGGASDAAVCPGCIHQCLATTRPRCPRCANPLPSPCPLSGPDPEVDMSTPGSGPEIEHELGGWLSWLCGACLAEPPAFDRTLVAADYALPVDQLVLQLKFGHRLALAPLFAGLLRDVALRTPDLVLPALLCPVPLGPRRLAERGYNQALEIARPLARCMGVALHARLVLRVQDTAAQSSVAPDQRQQNIAGAFVVPDAALVAGRHIGVVDDVMTSGHTLNELAATLKRHGAAQVSNFVFARTPPH
ncbi:ComF family protein [Duganella sp. FT80W]|uniref:ComF family protein n=1 Tax=Duganella guangzhouensis TaxID=2666084 RepID=A0A6I2L0L7_9BURK|nr:ComF family protein [Duganella guangzhouensis]MRW91701.1 ComF family protein [Duganella guangzhouensis]